MVKINTLAPEILTQSHKSCSNAFIGHPF